MAFREVYRTLLDLFPLVDNRALRAVAMEHQSDADAAVGAVLEEVIPFFVGKSRPSSPLSQSVSQSVSSVESTQGAIVSQTKDESTACTVDSAEVQSGYNVNNESQQSLCGADNGSSEPFYDAYDGHHEGEDTTPELTLTEETRENRMKMNANMCSHGEPTEVLGGSETEAANSGDKFPESTKISSHSIPQHALEMPQNAHLDTDLSTTGNEENDLDKSCEDGNNAVNGPSENSVQLVQLSDIHGSSLEELEANLTTDTASYMSSTVGIEDESTLTASMSQSNQIRMVDVVEEAIADAKNNKKKLFTAMKSVTKLIEEVKFKEQHVEKAKEDAAMGGDNTQDKVEEIKQMLRRAEEANSMYAGHVYGERAILATELKELQSRVLSLSDERDKSLALLDEMRQTLGLRLAAAENEMRSAELEKQEKEKVALELLVDQQLIMEKVAQESEILKQQAEANAKLQEFLLDRGGVLDMLQGEIAVICQDVKLLKEKIDAGVPFGQSLSSNQTSFILASSTSSSKILIPDQEEPVPLVDNYLDTEQKNDKEKASELEEAVRYDREALVDEGWEIFDNVEIGQ